MSNQLYNMFGGNKMPWNASNDFMSQFQQFRQQMQGKDPVMEINKLLQSGQISQQQLDQAQQMAYQMQDMLKSFK